MSGIVHYGRRPQPQRSPVIGPNLNFPPKRNGLLASLPENDFNALRPKLQFVQFPLGASIYESGDSLANVYFPVSGIISLLYVTENGDSAELAVVGREGMVGVSLFMGGETTPNRAVVQAVCDAYQLPSKDLKAKFAEGGAFQLLMLKFTQALITQVSQTAVCNLHHTIEQQLCRWLLLSLDRLPADEIQMTQELIANMLGVRRQGVTEAAGKLEKRGIIKYTRGLITVIDRRALEARCCECYEVVKRETDRLLPA
ncbi:MAG TPA: Crp/Fnr family transcriptional regulator [Burkholderiales bacterium]|nr:Crp/Fnr family transcriptional regulator [Burkholderiales bacterium]